MAKSRAPAQPVRRSPGSPLLRNALFCVALIAFTALAYLPAWDGQPVWDDDAHLTAPRLRSIDGLAQIWTRVGATQQYYPLVHTAFWIQHQLWSDWTRPYHLTNILLHAGSALLLWRILLRLSVPGAALAAAIFALHPVHVESVAWISELKNTLSAFVCLSAALVYLRFDETRSRAAYAVALVLFCLALMAKTVVATIPPALLVILWWRRGGLSLRRDIFPLLPFLLLGIASGLFTAWVERTHIGAQGADYELSLIERGLVAGRAFWFYLGKLVWPAKLSFIYPRWDIDAGVWWQYLFPAAAISLLAVLFVYRARFRGLLAGTLLFGGMLFPVLGFVNVYPFVYSFVADHFQYLASTAVIALSASGIARIFAPEKPKPWAPSLRYALCAPLLLVLAGLTWHHSRSYADAETLYRSTLRTNPAAWMAHNNLANILVQRGAAAEAAEHYRNAVDLRPHYVEARYNLGNVLLQEGEIDEAILHCEAALAVDPTSVEAHNNLGNALRQANRPAEAIAHYREALRYDPRSVFVRNNLAWTLATANDPALANAPEAVRLAEEADRIARGNNAVVLHTLAAAHAATGRLLPALEAAERGLELATAQNDEATKEALRKQIARFDAALAEQRPPGDDLAQ